MKQYSNNMDTRLRSLLTAPRVKQNAALEAAERVLRGEKPSIVVTQAAAARMLSVSRYTLRRWVQRDLLRPVNIPGRPRFRVEDLRKLAGCNDADPLDSKGAV